MKTTKGKPVIMGRRTFESMKGPLGGRLNIVMTRDADYRREGIVVVGELDTALEVAAKEAREQSVSEVMVIGGAAVYAEALPRADRLYVTVVHAQIQGDTFFPTVEWQRWKEVDRKDHAADGRNEHPFSIVVYERSA